LLETSTVELFVLLHCFNLKGMYIMITTLRKSFHSKIYKVILWITILALTGILSLPELLKLGSSGARFARVNNQTISNNSYMSKLALHEERINSLRAQFGPQADLFLQNRGIVLDPKVFAQELVIQDALLNEVAENLAIAISSDFIAEKLSNPLFIHQELFEIIPLGAFDESGMIDPRILQYYFKRIGMSMEDFEQSIAQLLSRRMVINLINQGSYVPDWLMRYRTMMDHSRKKFSILSLSFDRALQEEKKRTISDADVKAFYDKQNNQSKGYLVPETRSGLVWKVDPKEYAVEVTDREVEDYYENNKLTLYVSEPSQIQVRHILIKVTTPADKQSAYEKAKTVREQLLKDPKQFGVVASKESDDKGAVERSGLMSWFKRGEKEAAFDKAAFVLKENGDISDVIPTKDGFEIIQRVDKKAAVYKPLASVKKEIKDSLAQQKFNEQFAREMRGVIEQSKNAENNLDALIRSRGGKVSTLTNIAKDDSNWGTVLFGLHAKNDADSYIDKGMGYIVQLTNVKKSYLPALKDVRDSVESDIHEERAAQSIKKTLKEALEKAKMSSLSLLKDEFNASLTSTGWVAQSDTKALEDLAKKGIPTKQLFQLEKAGAVSAYRDGRDGFILKLDEIEALDKEALGEEEKVTTLALAQEQNRLLTAGFVASLYRSATIEISQQSNEPGYPLAYED